MKKFITITLLLYSFGSWCQTRYELKDNIHQWYSDSAKGVIIFFHGIGQRGHDINKVLKEGLPLQLSKGLQIPFHVFAAQDANAWWTLEESGRIIDYAKSKTGAEKVIITGLSSGGNGVYRLLTSGRKDILAAIPISINSLDFSTKLDSCIGVPVWVFHGENDGKPNLLTSTQDFVRNYDRKFPGAIKRTVFSGVGHNAWNLVYNSTNWPTVNGDLPLYAPFDQSIWTWLEQFTTELPPEEDDLITYIFVKNGKGFLQTKSGKTYTFQLTEQ